MPAMAERCPSSEAAAPVFLKRPPLKNVKAIQVDGTNIYGCSDGQVVNMVCGPAATYVTLTISGPERILAMPTPSPRIAAPAPSPAEYTTVQIIRNPKVRGGLAGVRLPVHLFHCDCASNNI